MKRTVLFITALILLVHFGCSERETNRSSLSHETMDESVQNTDSISVSVIVDDVPEKNEDEFLITETGVMGFNIGDRVDRNSENIRIDMLETGEGSYPVIKLVDDQGEEVGNIFTEFEDENRIRIIEVTSPKFKTKDGLGIGSTFRELKDQYPDSETHGSEIEGTTTCTAGSLSFLLDVYFSSYNIDESQVDPGARTRQVTITASPKRDSSNDSIAVTEDQELVPKEVDHYICFNQDDNGSVTIWVSYSSDGTALQVKYKGMDEVTDLVFREEENTNEGGSYPVIVTRYDVKHKGAVIGQYKITHSGIWDYVEYTRKSDSAVFNFTIDHEADPYGSSPCF